jgi:N-methylhydantoinase A
VSGSSFRVAVDVGGTFTDLVAYHEATDELRVAKVLTTLPDRAEGVLHALAASGVAPASIVDFVHGTTAATNAVLEGDAAPTAMLTTAGFRDALELMRGDRPLPVYDITWRKPDPIVPRDLRFEVGERLDAHGAVVTELDEPALRTLLRSESFDDVQAVAVSFLHSFLNDAHERLAAAVIAEERPDLHVSLSCDVNPEVREYERASTVALDAMLKPMMSAYLRSLEGRLREVGLPTNVLVMLANAGVMPITGAEDRPVSTLHSGPAGGVVGAVLLGEALGRRNLITADMGGTSFDVCAIVDGRPRYRSEGTIRWGIPFRIPLVDIGTIGAGGGSIAWVDEGDLLRVGPKSAGATPGPACYGRGGTDATVTDAAAVLGYFGAGDLAGGAVHLDPGRASTAIDRLVDRTSQTTEYVADGILQIAIANMAGEIRKNSVERGDDPREFTLFSFGGAGSMFAGLLARHLEMSEVIVPPHAGVFSAFGMLGADLRYDVQRTLYGRVDELDIAEAKAAFREAELVALAQFAERADDVLLSRELSLRYVGQRHELRVPLPQARVDEKALAEARLEFDRQHGLNYGHDRPLDPVEVRGLAVTATLARPYPVARNAGTEAPEAALNERRRVRLTGEPDWLDVPVYDRLRLATGSVLTGPAILESPDATVVIYSGQRASVHETGSVVIETR